MEPAGIIMPCAGNVAPQGCLFCDGCCVVTAGGGYITGKTV